MRLARAGGFAYQWDAFESEAAQTARMAAALERAARDAPRGGSVLLVSHGGPVSNLYAELAGRRSPPCGYCALYCFERATARPGGWEARLVAN